VKRNTYTGNVFQENGEQIAVSAGGALTGNAWSSEGRGNYWSDYAGFDTGGDGVGDIPYASLSLFEDLTAAHPGLRLFQLSPAADALDLAAEAFPVFQPQPKMADPDPLMAPPELPPVPGLGGTPLLANLLAALAMLAVALTVLAVGVGRPTRQTAPRARTPQPSRP
jgi:nitrous oxidase accessory protein